MVNRKNSGEKLMSAKEVLNLLGINNDRLKYFKKKKVFVSETAKAGYTPNDVARLKQLVILTKAGLTCDDIIELDCGNITLVEAFEKRKQYWEDKLSRIESTLRLSTELINDNVNYDSIPLDYYLGEITRRENEGEEFMDIDDWEFELEMVEDITCPNCKNQDTVDLEDYVCSESSDEKENGMGPDFVRYFDTEDNYECPCCGKIINISGWKREYPLGAFDSEDICVELIDK